MLKSIKVVLMVLLLSACAPQVDPKNEIKPVVFEAPSGTYVSSPVSIPYVSVNPIKITHLTEDETASTYTSVMSINGLKNASVQIRINTEIRKVVDKMKSYKNTALLPSYRGIKVKIKEGALLQNLYIYSNVTYNSNNVLSVNVNAYLTFLNVDTTTVYLSLMEGLTFDLSTGKLLNLSDVFTNGAKISELINNSLRATFDKEDMTTEFTSMGYFYGGLSLVGSFKGIQADQPFYLTNQGLMLMFDHRTPNFETGFSTFTVLVPFFDFIDDIGITKRFASTTDLYTQPIIDREFLALDDPDLKQISELITLGSAQTRLLMRYSADLSSTLFARLTAMKDKVKIDLEEYVADHTVDYIKGDAFMDRAGSYTCLYSSMEAYSAIEYKYTDEFRCYDKNDQAVNLKDYFIAGYDYESAIKKEFQKELDRGFLDSTLSTTELYDRLRIRITPTGFYITSLAHSAYLGSDQYVAITPLFSAFGLSNLTVFN